MTIQVIVLPAEEDEKDKFLLMNETPHWPTFPQPSDVLVVDGKRYQVINRWFDVTMSGAVQGVTIRTVEF